MPESSSMNSGSDLVLSLDRLQMTPDALVCRSKDHGRLAPDISGSVLMCGKCEYAVKVTGEIVTAAAALRR